MNKRESKISIIGFGWLGEPLGQTLQTHGVEVVGTKTDVEEVKRLTDKGLKTYLLRLPLTLCDVDNFQAGCSVTHSSVTGDLEAGSLDASGLEADSIQTGNLFDLRYICAEQRGILDALCSSCDIGVITLPTSREPKCLLKYQAAIKQLNQIALEYQIPHIIFTSSTSVYGNQTGVVNEFTELNPQTPSAIALVELESLLSESLGNRLTILRLAGLAGAERHPGRFFQRYQSNDNLSVQTHKSSIEGFQPINLVHRDDVNRAITTIINYQLSSKADSKIQSTSSKAPKIYNLCAPEHPLKADYYRFATEQIGLIAPEFAMNNASERIIDGSLITRELPFIYQFTSPYHFTYC